ncbi:MAG: hypothetical protein IJG57_03865 [Firmicutes bacterium]|nr:hypothetical protein [Bacillota bacterium]
MKKVKENKTVFALAMAVLWSITFGIAMNNWTIGICMGICFAIAFGLFGSEEDEKKDNEEDK